MFKYNTKILTVNYYLTKIQMFRACIFLEYLGIIGQTLWQKKTVTGVLMKMTSLSHRLIKKALEWVHTFLCTPSEIVSKIPGATTKTIKSKNKPPLLRIYFANLFKYCNTANRKRCNVLSGCFVSVKFSKSILCFARSSAK